MGELDLVTRFLGTATSTTLLALAIWAVFTGRAILPREYRLCRDEILVLKGEIDKLHNELSDVRHRLDVVRPIASTAVEVAEQVVARR